MKTAREEDMVRLSGGFNPDRITDWETAAMLIGVSSTPVPEFPVTIQVRGTVYTVRLANNQDVEECLSA